MTDKDRPLFYPLRFLHVENAVRYSLGLPQIMLVDGKPHVVSE